MDGLNIPARNASRSDAGRRMNYKRTFLPATLFVLFVFADQLTKYTVRSFGGFYICNSGIAFGINLPHWLILTLIIGLVFFMGLLIINLKLETCLPVGKALNQFSNKNLKIKNFDFNSSLPAGRQGFKFQISNYSLILVLSGAISNLIDRLYYGCVIDFINLKVWSIFNLADIFICLGVFLLIINLKKK